MSMLHQEERRNSEAVSGFLSSALGNLHLWGESAVPYFLFMGWHFQATGRPLEGGCMGTSRSEVLKGIAREKVTMFWGPARSILSCEGALLRRIRGGHNEDGRTEATMVNPIDEAFNPLTRRVGDGWSLAFGPM
jgi:hypothetical protein